MLSENSTGMLSDMLSDNIVLSDLRKRYEKYIKTTFKQELYLNREVGEQQWSLSRKKPHINFLPGAGAAPGHASIFFLEPELHQATHQFSSWSRSRTTPRINFLPGAGAAPGHASIFFLESELHQHVSVCQV
jgi:hypothetical protein